MQTINQQTEKKHTRYNLNARAKELAKNRKNTSSVVDTLLKLELVDREKVKSSRVTRPAKKERKAKQVVPFQMIEIEGIPKLAEFDGLLWDAAIHLNETTQSSVEDTFQELRFHYFQVIHTAKDKIGLGDDKKVFWCKYIKTCIWNHTRQILRERLKQKNKKVTCETNLGENVDLHVNKSTWVVTEFDAIDAREEKMLRKLYNSGALLYTLREKLSLGHRLTKWLVVDCLVELSGKSKEDVLAELVEDTEFVNVPLAKFSATK